MGLRDHIRALAKPTANTVDATGKEKNVQTAHFPSINAVYYPNWRVYRQQPPSSLNLSYITHIYYAFAKYCISALQMAVNG